MKRKSSVAFIVLGSTSALCFQTDALINNNAHPSRRQSTSSLMHQQSDSEYEYDIYYHENDVQPQPYFNVPNDITSFYPMQDDQFETIADVDSDQYGQDPIRNTVIGKTKTKPNNIMSMFSQVFPNQPKSELPSNPTSPRVSLPDLHPIISEKDLQKLTSRAIAGGKFVSSLIGDVLLNTAKLAIGALESNKTAESVQSISYTDVCEFDDELCREIEDALAATESFKSLSEQSRERSSTLNIQAATDLMNEEVSKSNTYEAAYEPARQSDAYSRIQGSNSAKQVSDYYFATIDQNSSTEDYYKRALEQQLIDIDQAKSNVRMRQEVAPSVHAVKSTAEPPPLARSKLLDDNVFEQRQRDKVAATRSTVRIDEQRTNPGRNTDTHDFERQSTLRRDNSSANRPARSSVSNVPVGASRPHNSRYESRKVVTDEAPDSIRLHITDEALAFARSLNLDVYEIYLSTRTPGSIMSGNIDGPMGEDVLTLDDVIWYCDRMQIGPMHRSAERRHQLKNDGRRPVRDQSRQAPKIMQSIKDHQLDARNKMIDQGRARRRSRGDVDMQPRERNTATREPRFIPRDYDKQSRLDSTSYPATDDRVPRFRQYPREKVTQRPPLRTVSNSDPRNPIRRHDHYPSSMSRLIAAEPTISSQSIRPSRKSTMSTVSLAKLIQGPKEMDAAQVPTNRFREPYQEGKPTVQRQPRDNISGLQREVNSNSISPRVRSTQLSLRELSERASPVSTSEKSTAYYTEGALEMAQKHGINLENVSSGSDDPITSDDVKHYIESRKSVRASRLNGFPSQRESHNELTYEEFASYFNSETASKLQQHQRFRDTSGTT